VHLVNPLERLAADWDVEMVSEGSVVARARITSEWIGEGRFLLHRSETVLPEDAPQLWRDHAPKWSTVVMGADDRSGRYAYLYADSRRVNRVYEMALDGNEWRVWGRAAEEFFQRFLGVISDDGRRIDSRWERSTDAETWELDFEGRYTRV
jgi:hypothetical protein